MKKTGYIFGAIVVLVAYILSACGVSGLQAAVAQEQFVEDIQSQDVAYTGVIQAINGSQWTINGVEVTVEPSVVQGGPFIVGDTVKVEGMVSSDGGLVVVQVESPSAADLSDLPGLGETTGVLADDDNNNSNTNINGDDDDDDNTNANENSNINGDDDDDDDNANLNANSNTNDDDDDDDDNANSNTNDDDDDDDDNTNNNNTNDDDDDDDDSTNTNTNVDDDD